jgi:hypothetical protein
MIDLTTIGAPRLRVEWGAEIAVKQRESARTRCIRLFSPITTGLVVKRLTLRVRSAKVP